MNKIPIILRLLAITLLSFITACSQHTSENTKKTKFYQNPSSSINYYYDTEQLIHHIKELSSDAYQGRRTDTPASLLAQDYIINHFIKSGIIPLYESYKQKFEFESDKKIKATNIIGYINGSEYSNDYIVLSAHYDHLGVYGDVIYNGADDNASGVGALLAFAQYFKKNPPKHNVIIAAFDAEELGMKGAEFFVENSIDENKNIVLNINMDMISRSVDNQLFVVGTRYNPYLIPVINGIDAVGNVEILIGHEGMTPDDDWTYSGDHSAFHRAGIPFIYFGVEDHPDYHQPTDTFNRIDQAFYKDAVQAIIMIFKRLDK
ncbi:M28 family peptidase [Ostreibacterium oceani]|uniref:M28 family peptidase n=1 Tax=Ostreibacterium oceani TaxID=2654998 RepID=A0A6N7ETJ9_9GAMM|nr:M28 family peptidase [Ostreibacterium oceani]MPV85881.1 M28 family peptidase [Ostreibacterium oceani]